MFIKQTVLYLSNNIWLINGRHTVFALNIHQETKLE